jgi:DNA-binding transcriptional ArsR family regulator
MARRRNQLPGRAAVTDTVALFAALANPLRLRLLVALSRFGELSAGELQRVVGAEQSAVSHQLAALRLRDLVKVERDGRRMMYSLADQHVAHIVEDAIAHVGEGA